MKRAFCYKITGDKVCILKKSVGLFGPQLETVVVFDSNEGNVERVRQIVKQFNECDRCTQHSEP